METEKATSQSQNGNQNPPGKKRKRSRWGDAPAAPATPAATTAAADPKAKALALQESVRQRLAALKKQKQQTSSAAATATTTESVNHASLKRPADEAAAAAPPITKKAKHYQLDLSVTGPSFKPQQKKEPEKKKINPYLSHRSQKDEPPEEEELDERLATRAQKVRKHHKPIHFVEPGTFVEIGERKRQRALNAAQSGFSSGRKAGMYVQAAGMASVYGSSTEHDDGRLALRPDVDPHNEALMPHVMEWWDVELLPSKLKKQVASQQGKALQLQTQAQMQQLSTKKNPNKEESFGLDQEETMQLAAQCFEQASLSYSKTAQLIQHIVPIPNGHARPSEQPTLYLTKKERKRQRKLKRAEKQRQLQDMQAAGLVAPPEARLTLRNFIQVLGDQAYVDPSKMEQKVLEQMQKRQQAHLERNEANRLTKEQRSEKRKRKLQEDTSHECSVALFFVKDMSHPYHRTKVDLNAQQQNITGGVLECLDPPLACVIAEGGPKAIKRYTRLMTVRMKWEGTDDAQDESEEEEEVGEGEEKAVTHKFNPDNRCELVWTGMGAKRLFKGFVFQQCETSDQARSVLHKKGVAHFWDQVVAQASGKGDSFHLKLAGDSEDEEDVVMQD